MSITQICSWNIRSNVSCMFDVFTHSRRATTSKRAALDAGEWECSGMCAKVCLFVCAWPSCWLQTVETRTCSARQASCLLNNDIMPARVCMCHSLSCMLSTPEITVWIPIVACLRGWTSLHACATAWISVHARIRGSDSEQRWAVFTRTAEVVYI